MHVRKCKHGQLLQGMISKLKPRMFLLNLKNEKCKICITVFITKEICYWLSPFRKQTASQFSPPTKVTSFPFTIVHVCIYIHALEVLPLSE